MFMLHVANASKVLVFTSTVQIAFSIIRSTCPSEIRKFSYLIGSHIIHRYAHFTQAELIFDQRWERLEHILMLCVRFEYTHSYTHARGVHADALRFYAFSNFTINRAINAGHGVHGIGIKYILTLFPINVTYYLGEAR